MPEKQTHDNGWIGIISQKLHRQRVRNVIYSSQFDIDPLGTSQQQGIILLLKNSLQANICIVLLLGSETFVALQALSSYSGLKMD